MPLFEYSCRGCGRRFEALVYGAERPGCPACGGRKLEKLLSTFAVGASAGAAGFDTGGDAGGDGAADADDGASGGGCGTCGDPRGPGACGPET
ncbi:MAG: FmdB family zinc ribbon protein [Candidatus Polarisedimenticolia bacterium]